MAKGKEGVSFFKNTGLGVRKRNKDINKTKQFKTVVNNIVVRDANGKVNQAATLKNYNAAVKKVGGVETSTGAALETELKQYIDTGSSASKKKTMTPVELAEKEKKTKARSKEAATLATQSIVRNGEGTINQERTFNKLKKIREKYSVDDPNLSATVSNKIQEIFNQETN